jgi:hypothetical protein
MKLSQEPLKCLYKFSQLLPLFKNRNINEFVFIDEHLSIMLLKYLLLQCIYQYITSANSQEIVSYSSEKVYNERKQSLNMLDDAVHNSSTIDVHRNEENTELLNELEEININIESGYSIGLKTSELISSILLIEEKDKKKLNISYDNIVRKVSRAKDHERHVLYNDYLGSMSIEERRVANAQKKYKLGEWNVGTQKSIYQYNPTTYVPDADRKVGFFEVNNTAIDVTDENPLEVDNIENTDRDTHDISHLTEDYMDGDFYPEDRDPDDFYGNT